MASYNSYKIISYPANLLNNMDFDMAEDRVTGALFYFLEKSHKLFKSFLNELGLKNISTNNAKFNLFVSLGKNRPDGEILLDNGILIVIESKIELKAVRNRQISRYRKQLNRRLETEHLRSVIIVIISPSEIDLDHLNLEKDRVSKIWIRNLCWMNIVKMIDDALNCGKSKENYLLEQLKYFILKKGYNLSKHEINLISFLETRKIKIVNSDFLTELYGDKKKVGELVCRLTEKGRLKQLARTKYLVVPIRAPYQEWSENEFIIADALMDGRDYYIGYNNMFNFYGFTPQIPQTTFILSTRFSKRKVINGKSYKFIKINENKLYGLTTLEIDGRYIRISDKERTLVDLVYNFKPVGSIKEALRVMKSEIKKINLDKFIRYATKFPNIATRKRIGYCLSNLRIKEEAVRALIKSITKSNTLTPLYESKSRKGKIDKKWKLIING